MGNVTLVSAFSDDATCCKGASTNLNAKNILSWSAKYDLDDGLKESIDYWRNRK